MSKAIDLENGLPAIKTWVEGKFQQKETGKGLSTNDYTTDEKTKLGNIAAGAQVNVIESVKVNGTALAVSSKAVDVPKATNSTYGAVILSDATNGTAAAASGGTAATPKAVADALTAAKGAIPSATTTAPKMNGTAAVGSETKWAKGDHVHPTDTSRAPLASPEFTGTPKAPTAAAGTNTTQIATTEFVTTAVAAKADTNTTYDLAGTAMPSGDDGYEISLVGSDSTIDTITIPDMEDYTTQDRGLLTATDKEKLDGIEEGAQVNVAPDSALSTTSTNAVQNKVINTALSGKVDASVTDDGATTAILNNGVLASATYSQGSGSSAIYNQVRVNGATAELYGSSGTTKSASVVANQNGSVSISAINGNNTNSITLNSTQTTIENVVAPTANGDAANKKYVDDALTEAKSYADGKVTGLYSYKGSVATYSALPASPATGDVYNVEAAYQDYPAGTNWAWTGTVWDALGGSFTITYATAAEVTAVLNA